ncbi:Leucine-rich repeat-containing N-terminal, plant-type [Dillenia turbinata]|uniref:Leucine-rich repeat-containing N-terminal, plant-type n=1 Tax=Dillenia turbinata TaxID=194707 RepID=A0AAN8W4T5_9MAGN
MKTLHFFCLSLFLFSLYTPIALSRTCNADDKKVLLQIKASFGNPYILASWQNDTDCCDWYNVECDSNGRIISLTIFDGTLSGEIPAEIANLPYLQMIDLNTLSDLHGSIPDALSKLTNLNFLRLKQNKLTGSIPPSLSKLTKLTFFDVSHNQLTGTIPGSLSNLGNLNALHLDNNELSGAIPDSFGNFGNKQLSLYLSNNQLVGSIPAGFANMHFDDIDLSHNKLSGNAYVLFSSDGTSQTIDISYNMFSYDFSKTTFPSSLTYLDINHNSITGSLPAAMTGLNLQLLNVSYNRLCGQIPVGGKLQSFDSSSYDHNKCLCGSPLPAC